MALDCFVVFELSNATWMFSSPHNDINVVVASSLHFFPRDAMMPRMFANEHANDTAGITDNFCVNGTRTLALDGPRLHFYMISARLKFWVRVPLAFAFTRQ